MSDDVPIVQVGEDPPEGAYMLPPLYKIGAAGKEMMWQVGFDGDHSLVMRSGFVHTGVVETTTTEVDLNTSGRTMREQSFWEARQRYRLKLRKDGYRPAGEAPPEDKEPMLAFTWISAKEFAAKKKAEKDAKSRGLSKEELKKFKVDSKYKVISEFPVAVQPKLDGIRNLAKMMPDGTIRMRSRGSKVRDFFYAIREELLVFFEYLPGGSELDGELYSHELFLKEKSLGDSASVKPTFNTLSSIIKKVKEPSPDEGVIQFYIFDIRTPDPLTYGERYNLLVNAYEAMIEDGNEAPHLVIVPSEIVNDDEEIDAKRREYIEQGYEGLMVRTLDGLYKKGRSKDLLKSKEFDDEEGECIGVKDSKGTEKGAAVLIIRDIRGNEFPVRMRDVSIEERREWLSHPEMVIGKEVTFRFQGLSEYGVPRFPIGVAFRDYE